VEGGRWNMEEYGEGGCGGEMWGWNLRVECGDGMWGWNVRVECEGGM
jgi:hypothetical protein